MSTIIRHILFSEQHVNRTCRAGMCMAMLMLTGLHAVAQKSDTASIFSQPVVLDSFVVKSNFDVDAFIHRVKNDTTFYKAFKNLHFASYAADNTIQVFDANRRVIASYNSTTRQKIHDHCRQTEVITEHVTGDFYAGQREYRYYTAKLFDHIFFAKTPVCNESDIVAGGIDAPEGGKLEKSEYQLKQLMFNPGGRVGGVPFMAARESIFDAGEAQKYDFRIEQKTMERQECYVFHIMPKKGYEHKVLYNELTTWFRVSDYSIVARDYSLSYSNLLYDFDVHMSVRLAETGGKLYPTFITYNGDWHIVTRKRERAAFTVKIKYD